VQVDDLPRIDPSVAHAARVYDYLLGGATNFAADREAAERQAAAFGGLEHARKAVQGNRFFLGQAVRYLAAEAGIRQFLDLGTGLPNEGNVHVVAQQAAPDSRVVYVDHDPVVLAHAHELLRSTPDGATAFILGDVADLDDIIKQAAETLDLSQPIAVMLVALLHLVPDEVDPHGIVSGLLAAVTSGSYLVVSHMASDIEPDRMAALARAVPPSAGYRLVMRSQIEVTRFFDGLELVEPGVVPIDRWRPEAWPTSDLGSAPAHHYGGIARKP